jgi:hypothetical protein
MKKGQFGEPWKVGALLNTRFTDILSEIEKQRLKYLEAHEIYLNFTHKDIGRSRKKIATINERVDNYEEVANRICACVNALDGLNPEKLQALIEAVENITIATDIHCKGGIVHNDTLDVLNDNLKRALDALKGE